jgi:hypothetical protein
MNVVPSQALSWSEIDLAPEGPGVYAWYSRLVVSKADLDEVVGRISSAKLHSEQSAYEEVRQALDKFVFGPYRESPYRVSLRGQLKPRFSGQVEHEPPKTDTLVGRLVQDPERLRAVAEVLRTAAPWFTAPLYIGMAAGLRARLRQHKSKIVDLRDQRATVGVEDVADAGFANQVVARNFDPTNLFVHVAEMRVENTEYNDIENILNRINYPIFGRN